MVLTVISQKEDVDGMNWKKIYYPYSYLDKTKTSGNTKKQRERLFNEFIEFFEFDSISSIPCVADMRKFFLCDRSFNQGKYREDSIPFDFGDHGYVYWKKGTNIRVMASHPYDFNIEHIEKWCNERDLYCIVCPSEKSFYYPCCTPMILIMHSDVYVSLLSKHGFPLNFKSVENV